MTTEIKGPRPNSTLGGWRTRHVTLGIGTPIQSTALAAMHFLCGSGFFDNPITYTTIVTTAIGLLDYFRNSGRN